MAHVQKVVAVVQRGMVRKDYLPYGRPQDAAEGVQRRRSQLRTLPCQGARKGFESCGISMQCQDVSTSDGMILIISLIDGTWMLLDSPSRPRPDSKQQDLRASDPCCNP